MRYSKGYTLIELLVVVAIIGIVMSAAFAGYRTFNARQLVVTSGKELLVALRQAQSGASSGTKTPNSCRTTPLEGHRIEVVASDLNSYSVYEVYRAACNAGSTLYFVKTVRLAPSVRFSGAFAVTFLGLSGGATLSGATPQTIRVCNNNCAAGAVNYSISVSKVGSIQDLGVT
jgi:prepilin-type N-terminal cleavage/methylation domain-containing protein